MKGKKNIMSSPLPGGKKRSRDRGRPLATGMFFFPSISLLFTNEIFRCYLQQLERPTTASVKPQLQHFYHHSDASTRNYHPRDDKPGGLEAQTPLGRVSFFTSFYCTKKCLYISYVYGTTNGNYHQHHTLTPTPCIHVTPTPNGHPSVTSTPSTRAGSGEDSGRSRGQGYFSFSFFSLYYMFIHN
jgi:hypothetical protein